MRVLAYILSLIVLVSFTEPQERKEYENKFGFLMKLTRFIKWPAEGQKTFKFYSFQDDPFGGLIEEAVNQGKQSRGLPLKTNVLTETGEQVQILFVPSTKKAELKAVVDAYAGKPVLIVSEQKNGAQQGAIINLLIDNGKMVFEVNKTEAKAKGIEIHSKVLKLAKKVF